MSNYYERYNKCKDYKPVWVEGESYYYYFNYETALDNTDFNDYILYILDDKFNIVSSEVPGLKQDTFSGNEYRLYVDPLTIPTLPNGDYYLYVENNTSNELVLISNPFQMVNDLDVVNNDTMLLTYKHYFNIYNYNYEELLNSSSLPWYNSIRVNLSEIDVPYSFEAESNREVTTGKLINPKFDIDKTPVFETGLFDREAHEAMAVFLMHSDKTINGDLYDIPSGGGYNGEKEKSSPIWAASFELVKRAFSETNLGQSVFIPAPDNLSLSNVSTVVTISWDINSLSAEGTQIEKSTTGGGVGFTLLTTTDKGVSTYDDTIPTSITFYYRVRSLKGTNYSAYSSESSITV